MDNLNQEGDVRFISASRERLYRQPVEIVQTNLLDEIRPALARIECAVERGLHAAGYLAYEAAPAFDAALTCHSPVKNAPPLLWFGIYDHATLQPWTQNQTDPLPNPGPWAALVTRPEYDDAIARIRDLIAAGDTYQVNYAFPLSSAFHGDADAWFRRLYEAQQTAFNAYLHLGHWRILSASPELFFRLDGLQLETRPMKGTRTRGLWPEADQALARELAGSPKERAENLMIVDLLRNDMGRISKTGSVCVRRLFELERYNTVWQMTSTITARTDAPVPNILAALFPSGSVTGAPKVRTMQIIRELEPHPRGVYCGAIGWWAPNRTAEFSVAIRTATLDTQSNTARYHVGSGITWDSVTNAEYEECHSKARILAYHLPEFELLESMLFDEDYYLLSRHLVRLGASAAYFGFQFDRDAVDAALADEAVALRRKPSARWKVRLRVSRKGSIRVNSEPAKPATPVRLGFAPDPVDERDVFLYHKTTFRRVYDTAKASRPDCDDVILWNRRGEITETTAANLVLTRDGAQLTPPVASGLLGGTLRAELIEAGALTEVRLTRDDLRRAAAVYLINSVRKWVEAELVE